MKTAGHGQSEKTLLIQSTLPEKCHLPDEQVLEGTFLKKLTGILICVFVEKSSISAIV